MSATEWIWVVAGAVAVAIVLAPVAWFLREVHREGMWERFLKDHSEFDERNNP